MQNSLKTWRESASLILIAKTNFSPNKIANEYNYKLLSLKRSSKAGFMPGTYVFPGGAVCPADGSRDWLKLYETFGFQSDSFEKLNPKENRTPIFTNDEHSEIPKFLTLRICAIRETFEECGILLCRSFKMNYQERLARWASFIGGTDIKAWQEIVQKDPHKFLELCFQYEIYPDVWALKEWSNWVTPPSMPLRFDAIFFLAAFQQQPPAAPDKKEVQELEWATPTEYLAKNRNERIILPPPQFYEMSRLQLYTDIEQLSKFAHDRSAFGVERYFPHRVDTGDGIYTILPGDDLYPQHIDPQDGTIQTVDKLPECNVKNRVLHKGPFNFQIIKSNFTPKCNHLAPINYIDVHHKY